VASWETSGWERQRAATSPARARLGFVVRASVAGVAIIAGGLATLVTASAHSLNSTTPLCSPVIGSNAGASAAPCTNGPNVVGSTSLLDSAAVTSTSDRSVKFMLWAPGTCGVNGQNPVFTETDLVGGSATSHSATIITQGSFPAAVAGVYEWTAELLFNTTVESGPTKCADEQANVIKATPSVATTPSIGGTMGVALTDVAHLSGGDNPGGSVTFNLFGPNDPACSGTAVQTFTGMPVSNGSATTTPAFVTTKAGVYHWAAAYGGDTNNFAASAACGEPVTVTAPASSVQGTSTGVSSGVQGVSTPGTGSGLAGSLVIGALLILGGAGLVTFAVRVRGRGQNA
jgi:hypothetical protein